MYDFIGNFLLINCIFYDLNQMVITYITYDFLHRIS